MIVQLLLLLTTAAVQYSFARTNDSCEYLDLLIPYSKPIPGQYPINTSVRIECADGFMRKAGTSSQFTCKKINATFVDWVNPLHLKCICNEMKVPTCHHKTTQQPTTAANTQATEQFMTAEVTNETRQRSSTTLKITTENVDVATSAIQNTVMIVSRKQLTTQTPGTSSSASGAYKTLGETLEGTKQPSSVDNTKKGAISSLLLFVLVGAVLFVCWRLKSHRQVSSTDQMMFTYRQVNHSSAMTDKDNL